MSESDKQKELTGKYDQIKKFGEIERYNEEMPKKDFIFPLFEANHRRNLGVHLTSVSIFNQYILPKIENKINEYIWVDLFAGEGNLILPILNKVPENERLEFFKQNIFLFDIQERMVSKSIENAALYGIPEQIAKKNIILKDTLNEFPIFLKNMDKPVYHITNPPYLYIGYIAKHRENSNQLKYFSGTNKGLQDLYQLALMNDLRNSIKNMIYIIPSNFLFGHSVSNLVRKSFLKDYTIKEAIIFEKKIFENTGTNVAICFFEREKGMNKVINFDAVKINSEISRRKYTLTEENNFRAGQEFEEYVKKNKKNVLNIKYYLKKQELDKNLGDNKLILLDSKEYKNGKYTKRVFFVNDNLYRKIRANPLFIRTVDTGSENGKVGLYFINEVFGTDGIYVDGSTYRTNPIQAFIEPTLSKEQLNDVRVIFNRTLNNLRNETDGEFMTTYKYSDHGKYTRKYLGLSQARDLLETINIFNIKNTQETL